MTSPSHKNHPTTAQPSPTRSKSRSLWRQLLAGVLCLAVAEALPANDREVGKPLDRLKQRSARQRWRELRGDWEPAPELHEPLDTARPAPFSSPFVPKTLRPTPTESREAPAIAPIPAPSDIEPMVAPVPEPMEPAQPAEVSEVPRPGSKPELDPNGPLPHPGSLPEQTGSFADVVLEPRAERPRERMELNLPNWPFEDDLDRLLPEPDVNPLAEAQEPAPPSIIGLPSPSPLLPEPPLRVAELPSTGTADVPAAEPQTPVVQAVPEPAPVEPDTVEPAPVEPAKPRALPKLRSIREIQPFADYEPEPDSKLEGVTPPEPAELVHQGSLDRQTATTAVYWHASNVTHNPLYFEDPGLERSGHAFSDLVQPFVSVGRFGAQVVALPYSIALDPVWKDESPLGHYRPGECAPKRHLALPLNREAVATAAAAYTGIIYLIP